jgi:6-phosphogluconolactonase (cycloisomerase 2 family)
MGAAGSAADADYFVYVDSYTDAPSHSRGIYAWSFTSATGATKAIGLVAETVNPAYVVATPDHRFL